MGRTPAKTKTQAQTFKLTLEQVEWLWAKRQQTKKTFSKIAIEIFDQAMKRDKNETPTTA